MSSYNNTSFTVDNVDDAVINTLNLLLKHGTKVSGIQITNNTDPFIELENVQFTLTNPLDRISTNKINPFNLIAAIGRLTWILAGNDRVEDIAFYQPKSRDYSDNDLTLGGSDYGKRIFDPIPDTDQLQNVIDLLKHDPTSRRAAIPIWSHHDSHRLGSKDRQGSKDIPCAFGLFFLIRNNELHSTLVMRSNNSLRLLPVNIFEFSIIAEIVAAELGIEYGKYVHNTISMHAFEKDMVKVQSLLNQQINSIPLNRYIMPKMPSTPSPLKQAKKLAKLEALLRNDNVLIDASHINEQLENARQEFGGGYWFEFFRILCIGALLHAKEYERAKDLSQELPDYFRISISSYLDEVIPQTNSSGTLDSYIANKSPSKFIAIKKEVSPDNEEIKNIVDVIHSHVDNIENESRIPITRQEYRKLEEKFLKRYSMAARSVGQDIANSEDLRKISKEEILDELKRIRSV